MKIVTGSNKLQTEAQKFVTSRNTKAKKKSDEANMLIRASKVNSHCGITLEKYMVITICSLSTELL